MRTRDPFCGVCLSSRSVVGDIASLQAVFSLTQKHKRCLQHLRSSLCTTGLKHRRFVNIPLWYHHRLHAILGA